MKDLEDMNLSAMQYRDEQRNEFTQVTAQCKCGRGGWLRLPKHPDLDSYIPKQELSRLLDMWKDDIVTNFTPKCSFCGIKSRKVVGQVAKGISAQEDNHLPRNWGYYCQRCYDVGSELEREAMYG